MNKLFHHPVLITKDGKTEEFKHAYNDVYSKYISYGISLKVVTKE